MEHRAGLSAAEREIERIEVRREKLIEMVMSGVAPSEVKDELNANATKREELKATLAAADAPPSLLHPEMAGLYRQKVTALAQALEYPETRTEASEALRGLIDAIVLTPNQGNAIELKGNLAAMLGAAKRRSNGRPFAASCDGCGGSQPTLSAALATCGLRVRRRYVPLLFGSPHWTISATGSSVRRA